MSKPLSDNFKLPSIFQDISDPNLKRVKEILERLSLNPPQVLLFDGGTEEKRRSLAFYWATCNLCRNFNNGPCLTCPDCLQVADLAHRDLLAFDGFISNSEDEDNPGFFRAFNADNARNLKIALRDAPHGKHRVVFFTGIAGSKPEAPN
ncbi:MAG: DNA polymerase III subunit delta', partial [Desulfovibrionaceae bacterium]|nr:DNA polymerase III subunit delta' [Desulfovibrionaceae bacterium]